MDAIRQALTDYFIRSAALLKRWNEANPHDTAELEWVEDFTFWYFGQQWFTSVSRFEVEARIIEMAQLLPTGLVQTITGNGTPLGRRGKLDSSGFDRTDS